MELFEAIRRDDRVEQLSVRALADKYGVHRRTVRQALANAVPAERKTPVRVAPKLDPAKGLIDAMLTEDLTAPRVMSQDIGIARTYGCRFGLTVLFGVGPGGRPVPW